MEGSKFAVVILYKYTLPMCPEHTQPLYEIEELNSSDAYNGLARVLICEDP